MFKIDVEALARTGAQIRLDEIQSEVALLCGAFPDLCQPEPLSQPEPEPEVETRRFRASDATAAKAAERGLTIKQYLAMRRNARRARQAMAQKRIAARLGNILQAEELSH